jgi:integrase
MICAGMRKGAVLGLHWADVDLEARALFVRLDAGQRRQ